MPFPPAFLDELNNRNPIEDVVGQYVTADAEGLEPVWPVPVPLGENAVFFRRAGQGDLLLLWLPQGRRRGQFHHGN